MADAANITLTPPAAPVDPGQAFTVHAVLTNTGTADWPAGGGNGSVRVGSESPRDNFVWGGNRWDLPSAVPAGGSVAFDLALVAPNAPGARTFAVGLVREGVAWFPQTGSCPITVTSAPPPPPPPPPPIPAPRADSMDLISFQPFPYYRYLGQSGGDARATRSWQNTTNRTLKVRKAYLWTGIDFNGLCDTDCVVRRRSDGAMLVRIAWDHYQNPTHEAGKTEDFGANYVTIPPGEWLDMAFMANFFTPNGNPGDIKNAAHICELWVEG